MTLRVGKRESERDTDRGSLGEREGVRGIEGRKEKKEILKKMRTILTTH